MGVIAVRNEDDIWGASNLIIYSIIEYAILKQGNTNYLVEFKNQFDWGYNGIDLYNLNDNDHSDFLSIVRKYLGDEAFSDLGYEPVEVKTALQDLINRMEKAQSERVHRS